MSPWQRFRTFWHLFIVGIRRRMVIGARLVLIDGDKVLLVKHTYLPGWHFPGGGVEPGETAGACAVREGNEETGYLAGGPLQLLGFYLKANAATNRDHVAVYVCRQFTKTREFKRDGEIAAMGWFGLDELPADVNPGTARRIDEIRSGAAGAALW